MGIQRLRPEGPNLWLQLDPQLLLAMNSTGHSWVHHAFPYLRAFAHTVPWTWSAHMFARQPPTSSPDFSQSLDSHSALTVAHRPVLLWLWATCPPAACSALTQALLSVPKTLKFLLAPKSYSRPLPSGQCFLISMFQLHSPETPSLTSPHRGHPPTPPPSCSFFSSRLLSKLPLASHASLTIRNLPTKM